MSKPTATASGGGSWLILGITIISELFQENHAKGNIPQKKGW